MSRWKSVRAAVAGGALVVAVWAAVALVAPARQTLTFPGVDDGRSAPQPREVIPPLDLSTITDPNVEPAQYKERVPGATASTRGAAGASVADPPSPVVTVRVRVPADALPGDDLKYLITVQNTSGGDAHSVSVRVPMPPEADLVRSEPLSDKPGPGDKPNQLVWSFGTLKGGASKQIELTLRPKPNVTELKTLAYVKFEHGEAVTTKIGKPTVKVSKTAPKQAVRDETYRIRVQVENTGKTPAEAVRVLENLPASAEVEPVTAGAKRVAHAEGQQWVWEFPKLQPGERKVIEYRVTAREARDVIATTGVVGQKIVPDKPAEARTEVLVPGLEVKLTGPTGVVNAGESAKYEIVVRNTGTLPSTNLKVTGTIPADCKPTQKTDGGQLGRDSIVWQVPRLGPGEAQSFRYALKAGTTGRRQITASATDARGTRGGQEVATVFAGVAALTWETTFNPVTVAVGKQGVFTVKVKNSGGEVARNVRLEVKVPDAVSVVQTTPNIRIENNVLQFAPEEIKGNGETTYTITFEGKKTGEAYFVAELAADCLGDRPLDTQKMINVIGGAK